MNKNKDFMTDRIKQLLLMSFLVIGIVYLLFHGLSLAKSVLAPIFLAIILAMVLTPVSNFLEKKGIKRGWSSFLSDLVFIIFILGILLAVGMEVQRLMGNWSSVQDRLHNSFEQVESFVEQKSGFTVENPFAQQEGQQATSSENSGQSQMETAGATQEASSGKSKSKSSGGGGFSLKDGLTKAMTWTFNSLTTLLLIVVYIFFMLTYRGKFGKAVLKFVPKHRQQKGKKILSEILEDAQQYLFGHVILITVLTVFYTIGFSIAGMKSAFTTALLASVLTLVPYVGTLIGNLLAIGMAFITTGNTSAVYIVIATVSIGQFFESYFLEPYVVGKRMNVNPLFTLFSVTIGAAVWGVIGMIVFLPLFSFVKAVADHIPLLHPIGYAIGKEDTSEGGGVMEKIKKKFK